MTEQAPFRLKGRNPDVLSCIANLSNDEVFTPPEFANRMLDTLTQAWANDNYGESIWANSKVTFLDPCTKSGVFLREIAKRLIEGLANEIPDLQERVNHILTQQVFGIGITRLTALLARRSLYCSKSATGEHSVATGFEHADGNVWFERTEHEWRRGKCVYCGASQSTLERGEDMESHAYAFIHAEDVKSRIVEIFGENMQFDVVIGNPPYQLASDGGTRDVPIYQHFVEQAKALEPRFLSMVIPSRWMAGGLGLDTFRDTMLGDNRIQNLVDFRKMDSVFPGVDFEGGVTYFLWSRDYSGECDVIYNLDGEIEKRASRKLNEFDVFVRDPQALVILKKVLEQNDGSITSQMRTNNEFGIVSNFTGYTQKRSPDKNIGLHIIKNNKRIIGWVSPNDLPRNSDVIENWKVLIPKSYGERGKIPAKVIGPSMIAKPQSVSSQTYMIIVANSEDEAKKIEIYSRTKFFRFMLSLRKISQHASLSVYRWVPLQTWNRVWTDEALYRKYNLTQDEIAFIESMIRPMDVPVE